LRAATALTEPEQAGIDEQLAAARTGQSSAFGTLVIAFQPMVYSLALRMLGARDLAQDLTQDVFMQLGDNLHRIESKEHLAHWLRRVTSHRAIDRLRSRSRFAMTPLDEDAQMFSTVDDCDPLFQRQLRLVLAELTPAARAVLLLRYQEDLDPSEIARTLDMPINTVKSHLKRSLENMRQSFAGAATNRPEESST
jgi:RNA polymerase sigma-70 factor, ECF subfamily